MANINFNDLEAPNNNGEGYKVGFFSIKNGEEAIVRFNIKSTADFNIYTVHPITVGSSSFPNRRVSCLRNNPKVDPVNICPLCQRNEKLEQRIYIPMIQYVNENGKIVPKAVIWDRPAYSYARQLKEYLDAYGPLTEIICKITRTGDKLDTKYTIMPNLNPQMYNEQMYPKDFSDFADFKVLGSIVMDKTFEEINTFIQTGQFPERQTTQNAATPTPTPTPANTNVTYSTTPTGNTPNTFAGQVSGNTNPVIDEMLGTGNSEMTRPVRYY